MALTRLFQLFVREEATQNTAWTVSDLFAAAYASYLPIDPSIEFEVTNYERRVTRASLTQLQPLSGTKLGRLRFSLELTASGTNVGVAQQYGLLLRACGMRQEICSKVSISSSTVTSGPMKHGESMTQETSGAQVTCIGDIYTGMSTGYYTRANELGNSTVPTTGALDWTGATSAAVFEQVNDAGNPTGNSALAWWPWSKALSTITFDATGLTAGASAGDLLRGVTSRALAYVHAAATTGANKVVYISLASGHFTNGEVIENVSISDTDVGTLKASSAEAQFQIPTLSMGIAKDGVREWITGARGTFRITANVGEPIIIDFDFVGKYGTVADGAVVSGVTYNHRTPVVAIGTALKFGGSSITYANEHQPCLRNWSVDMANDVQSRRCMASSTGLEEAQIIARRPTFSADPDLAPEALYDFVNRFVSNTAGTRVRVTHGTAVPDLWEFQMPGLGFRSLGQGDDQGVALRTIQADLHGGSQSSTSSINTDNELVIIQKFQ